VPGPNDRIRADEDKRLYVVDISSLNSLILDAIERLAIVETSGKFSDLQRAELLTTINRLGDRLGEATLAIRGISELIARVARLEERSAALDARLDAHDLVFAKTEGGLRAIRVVWGVVWSIVGATVALFVEHVKKGQ
jgi:hypothetical protein